MATPKIAGKTPLPADLVKGQKYAWCTCGESSNQPLCDGSHKEGGTFTPMVFEATETKTAYLCTCKQTNNPGFCDGSHKAL